MFQLKTCVLVDMNFGLLSELETEVVYNMLNHFFQLILLVEISKLTRVHVKFPVL